jgi:hypothetical protein
VMLYYLMDGDVCDVWGVLGWVVDMAKAAGCHSGNSTGHTPPHGHDA